LKKIKVFIKGGSYKQVDKCCFIKMKREEGSLQPENLCNMEQQANHEETKCFFGFVPLNYGIFGI
jgi:hypothetical protein